ncbi:MAG: hypothetical protein JWO15_3832 [Sphingomonadales bacterium]|nr:hypothetical protein [Sphingomonadales bacterium]
MASSHLRPVGADEKAQPKTPKSITEALDGTGRDVLAAMRRALAKQLDAGEISSNAIASAYKELRELDRLIRAADIEDQPAESSGGSSGKFDASAV